MGLLSNKISRDELKAGDHIYSWRSYIYTHHGIYVGDGKVIHFTRGGGLEIGTGTILDKIIVSSVPNHGGDNPCPDCGDQTDHNGVITSCLDCFLSGGNLYLFEYNVSKAIFLAKQRGGTCTIAASDPPEDVVDRAKFLLLRNGFGEYHLLDNNCEDFAIYCKTGLLVLSVTKSGSSSQVNSVSLTVSASTSALSTTLGAVATGVGAVALTGYGNYCISRLAYDVGVRKDVRKVPVEELVALMAVIQGKSESDNNNKIESKLN
ncbi:BnaC02g06510D [Brassica napus]|uniref:BnaC02g06510D protein n=1 Tax=Brassica napus TaxID=3708 RepID=A0A078HJT5_BRANA|nr:BnaC02g06510D [Brassica napus]